MASRRNTKTGQKNKENHQYT